MTTIDHLVAWCQRHEDSIHQLERRDRAAMKVALNLWRENAELRARAYSLDEQITELWARVEALERSPRPR